MKTLLAAGLALVALAGAAPVHAHVVEVTTSLPVEDIADSATLQDKLRSVVDDTLNGTITFQPTLVALTDARVLGERLYVRLLFADAEGERTLDALSEATRRESGPLPFPGPTDTVQRMDI